MYVAEDIEALISQFSGPEVESDVSVARKLLQKVLRVTSSGQDASELFPHVVKLLASNDLIVKKLACWYITQHGKDHRIILVINSLLKDCYDPNPMIRGLALQTLSSIQHEAVVPYAIQQVLQAVNDTSTYVRRAAVIACVKINQVDQEAVRDNGLVDKLYSMMRDTDPVVVVNCLGSLEEILYGEGGIVINKNINKYLLNRLNIFTDWGLVTVLSVLTKFRPKTEEEILDAMNLVDVYLKHSNMAVVMTTLNYFLHLIRDMPHLKGEVFNRAKSQIFHSIGAGNAELAYMLLEYVESILDEHRECLQSSCQAFFCRYNEPLYVKQKKVKLLPQITSQENLNEVLEELSMYCSDITPALSDQAIQAIGQIAANFPDQFDKCIQKLLDLLKLYVEYITSSVLKVLQHLDFHKYGYLDETLKCLPQCINLVTDDAGKSAILWLIGEYGEYLEESPYILETLIEEVSEEASIDVQLHLLTAGMKLLLKRPAECQEMFGTLLEHCIQSTNQDLHDKALFYYNLLSTDSNLARSIVCGHNKQMDNQSNACN